MDEILRIYLRRWQADPSDTEAMAAFASAAARTLEGGQPSQQPFEEILMDLLASHLDDEGVDTFTQYATMKLIRQLYGEEEARRYRRFLDGIEDRWFFEEAHDLDNLIREMPLRCGHSPFCGEEDVVCMVVGCICPGCFHIVSPGGDDYIDLCYHHHEIAVHDPDRFVRLFRLQTD